MQATTKLMQGSAELIRAPRLFPEQVESNQCFGISDDGPRLASQHGSSNAQDQFQEALKLAWAAGFLDGDGCISAVTQRYKDRVNPSIRLVVCLVQNDFWTLMIFQKILGAKSNLNPITRKVSHNRQIYQLTYNGKHAVDVLQRLEPYLVRKRMEACAGLELYREGELGRLPGPHGIRPEVLQKRAYWTNKLRSLK